MILCPLLELHYFCIFFSFLNFSYRKAINLCKQANSEKLIGNIKNATALYEEAIEALLLKGIYSFLSF